MIDTLSPRVVIEWGPVALTEPLLTSVALTGLLVGLALAARSRLAVEPSRWQTVLEALVTLVEDTVRAIVPPSAHEEGGRPDARLVAVVGALGLFIAAANLLDALPGLSAPVADPSVAAALAAVVFLASPAFGVGARGLRAYLAAYARPTPLMLPFNVIGELSRTVALAVRLFGNAMSSGLVVSVLLLVAGVLVPIPLIALGLLTGLVQAYIFAVLAAVYIGAAMREDEPERASASDGARAGAA